MNDGLTKRSRRAPIDIVPVTSGDLQKWLKGRKARLQRWVKSSDFRAAPASHCLVPNADGSLACVLAGIGCEDDPFAVSHLSAVLPAGNYRIAADWPRDRLERAAIGWALGAYQFTPNVQESNAPLHFSWLGSMGTKGIFDGYHHFELEPTETGTRFLQYEEFTGVVVPILLPVLRKSTTRGFEEMNQALKARVEGDA